MGLDKLLLLVLHQVVQVVRVVNLVKLVKVAKMVKKLVKMVKMVKKLTMKRENTSITVFGISAWHPSNSSRILTSCTRFENQMKRTSNIFSNSSSTVK